MRAFAIIFALAGLAAGYKIQLDKEQLIKVPKTGQCDPDMTPCPSGCCPVPPELNWFCCPDAAYPGCAATADDCPFETKRVSTLFIKSQSARAGAPSHVGLYSIDAIIFMVYSQLKTICNNR